MEELINAKKHFSKLGWGFAMASAIIYVLQIIALKIVEAVNPEWAQNGYVAIGISVVSMYMLGFPILILFAKKKIPGRKIEKHKMTVGQYVLSAIICLGLAYTANIVGNILGLLVGRLTGNPVNNMILDVVNSLNPWMILGYMVICAPIMEEIIFRKLIVDRTIQYGQGAAIVTSGLMFGLFHGNMNQFVYAAVIGMFLAFLYVKTGNLKITISLHMLFNLMGGLVSSQLIKAIDLEGYMTAASSGDLNAVMNHLAANAGGWIVYGIFCLYVFGVLIAGIILFIVALAQKKFVLEEGEISLPGKIKYSLFYGNAGMAVFIAFWFVMIIRQLLL